MCIAGVLEVLDAQASDGTNGVATHDAQVLSGGNDPGNHVRVFDGNSAVEIADALVSEGEREAAINVVQVFDGDGDVGTADALVLDGEREAVTNAVQVFDGGDVGTPMDVNAEATGASGEVVESLEGSGDAPAGCSRQWTVMCTVCSQPRAAEQARRADSSSTCCGCMQPIQYRKQIYKCGKCVTTLCRHCAAAARRLL